MRTGIFYGSTTGNTENAAELIGKLIEGSQVQPIAGVSKDDLESYELLILGTSTWGWGELQDDWAEALDTLKSADLSGTAIALFGLGDQEAYADTFVDGLQPLCEAAVAAGARLVGKWPTTGYHHQGSTAQDGDYFLGLALDEENQSDETEERINRWVDQLFAELR